MQFEQWIEQAYSLGASDLHLEADTPIVARIRGELQRSEERRVGKECVP